MIIVKRIYDSKDKSNGVRILVDRIWPRGISKGEANLQEWMKDVAPSSGLRKWFNHDPNKFEIFKLQYKEELKMHSEEILRLEKYAHEGQLILLFGAKDKVHNQAVILKEFLEEKS